MRHHASVTLALPLCALLLSTSCSYQRGFVYKCAPDHKVDLPPAPPRYGPHGRSQKFLEMLASACLVPSGRSPNDTLSQRFGRLMPAGTPPEDASAHRDKLRELAGKMKDATDNASGGLPAGMIFLGQFIDHDITLDVMSRLGEETDPHTINNLRTPRLDLDSVYLAGREGTPYLYSADGLLMTDNDRDFRRLPNGATQVAVIGDPRNDENGLIAQLHLLFQRFHNKVMAKVGNDFEEAHRLVTWHYQWIVRNEFLPSIVVPEAIAWAEHEAGNDWHNHPSWFWSWFESYRVPDMPVEFSVAAYRFGHSQVRSRYDFGGGRIVELFKPPASPGSLSSFGPVPPENVVTDWALFFDGANPAPNRANPIDTHIAAEVYELPFATGADDMNLAMRNMVRGDMTFLLPSGEEAADYFGVDRLQEDSGPIAAARACGLPRTPLWYYVLAEAEQNGGKLGPVGGRIVALTLIRMLKKDPQSYLNAATPWTPTELGTGGTFRMADLIAFTQAP